MQVMLTAQLKATFELTNESQFVIKLIPSDDDIQLHVVFQIFGEMASLSTGDLTKKCWTIRRVGLPTNFDISVKTRATQFKKSDGAVSPRRPSSHFKSKPKVSRFSTTFHATKSSKKAAKRFGTWTDTRKGKIQLAKVVDWQPSKKHTRKGEEIASDVTRRRGGASGGTGTSET